MDVINTPFMGMGLNVSQRLATRNSLQKLKLNENYSDVKFWGKIQGKQRDYLIAVATEATDVITKSFYFSSDNGLNFAKLPVVDEWITERCLKTRGMFTGNPAQVLKDPFKIKKEGDEEEEPEAEAEDEGDEGDKEAKENDPSKRKLNELERLAYTVQAVDADTCIVPRGSCFLTPTGEIARCLDKPLTQAEATNLDSYLLFRDPQCSATLARIRKLGVNNNFDFLDTIEQDKPKGMWSCQADESGANVTLRSLVWTGYEFQIDLAAQSFGGCYYGYGIRNDDVLFMV
eukprot:CAMPEP_0175113104 /NCGR_PEP_ID=MMETSP0086_2-20121207/15942_1 /TAXON_ID=136419 /ORGANISM="Unknown Unknown, Strain D1" /LENGTH=287 /DNA_ID=CAMNT_0016392259 /DNA_START=38 /DNA_END=901 /DNA_ORIENTATION=+